MGGQGKEAKYIIAFDPLDGSSNIDVNVSIGTIFSVHCRLPDFDRLDERQFFQKGRDQVLAGYILYGTSTVLVFSHGHTVHEFTLDQGLGEFLLSREHIRIPESCGIYSVNEGKQEYFQEKDRAFIEHLKKDRKCSTRYIGSGVADMHRNLIKGGIFMYPELLDKKTGEYVGKYRLNYEAKPFAFLFEAAGGMATDGKNNILDVVPMSLHQRIAFIAGNKDVIEEYLRN